VVREKKRSSRKAREWKSSKAELSPGFWIRSQTT
jgi:hypothetical protein